MNDTIEKLMAAKAALEAAQKACEGAGLMIERQDLYVYRDDADAVAACAEIAAKRIASAERRALPLAIGGTVRVIEDRFARNSDVNDYVVARIGRDFVYVSREHGTRETAFHLEGGYTKDIGSARIDADDLFRIKRDLVKPAKGGKR